MRFSDSAALDTSQVSDRRGMRMAPAAIGGTGIVGLLVYLAITLLSGSGGQTLTSPGQLSLNNNSGQALSASCRTGADANQRQDCRLVAVVNSVQGYWRDQIPGYDPAPTQLFS